VGWSQDKRVSGSWNVSDVRVIKDEGRTRRGRRYDEGSLTIVTDRSGDGHAVAFIGRRVRLVRPLPSASLAPESQDLNESYHPHDVLH
jgi:hypothetical protein